MTLSAHCQFCNRPLRWYFGEYGQTMEVCDTTSCENASPHHPLPVGDPLPKWKFKSRSTKGVATQDAIDLITRLIDNATQR